MLVSLDLRRRLRLLTTRISGRYISVETLLFPQQVHVRFVVLYFKVSCGKSFALFLRIQPDEGVPSKITNIIAKDPAVFNDKTPLYIQHFKAGQVHNIY